MFIGKCVRSMPEVWCFECAQWGGGSDVTSEMDPTWSTDQTKTVAWPVVTHQTPPPTCSEGRNTQRGLNFEAYCELFLCLVTSHPFVVSSLLSEPEWFRHSALQQWVLPRPDLRGSEPTGSVQWHAHWCQAGHHSELYLHPQDRGEWWDPPYLLLLSGNRPVERTGNRTWRGSSHDTRLTGFLSHQLCREGKFWRCILKLSFWVEGMTWRVKVFTCGTNS